MSKIQVHKIALEGETEIHFPGEALFLSARIFRDGIKAWFEVSETPGEEETNTYRIFRDFEEIPVGYIHWKTCFDGVAAYHIYQKYE
jgi:hypothetical protein